MSYGSCSSCSDKEWRITDLERKVNDLECDLSSCESSLFEEKCKNTDLQHDIDDSGRKVSDLEYETEELCDAISNYQRLFRKAFRNLSTEAQLLMYKENDDLVDMLGKDFDLPPHLNVLEL